MKIASIPVDKLSPFSGLVVKLLLKNDKTPSLCPSPCSNYDTNL